MSDPLMTAIEETVKLAGRIHMKDFSNNDLANENTQEPCQTVAEEAADQDKIRRYVEESYNAPERAIAIEGEQDAIIALYDEYRHDGVGFLGRFEELLKEKLNELI